MPQGEYREEVFNVVLALLLHQRGVVAAPEQALRRAARRRRHIPDAMVSFQGLRTVIEGKVDDQPNAPEEALGQAQERVDKGIAHIGIAVLYPRALRQVPFQDMEASLASARLRIAVCSEAGQNGWTEGDLDYLADVLRHTFHQLVQEDVVSKAVELLNEGIDHFSRSAFGTTATANRVAGILGIGEPVRRSRVAQSEAEEEE